MIFKFQSIIDILKSTFFHLHLTEEKSVMKALSIFSKATQIECVMARNWVLGLSEYLKWFALKFVIQDKQVQLLGHKSICKEAVQFSVVCLLFTEVRWYGNFKCSPSLRNPCIHSLPCLAYTDLQENYFHKHLTQFWRIFPGRESFYNAYSASLLG